VVVAEPAPAVVEVAAEPEPAAAVAEPAGWAAETEVVAAVEPVVEVAPAPAPEPEPVVIVPAAQSTYTPTPTVPAGWYADPSGRFELRYWDGNGWTEHVSRAGQQFTDPPVA
jgi:hypothetical protein